MLVHSIADGKLLTWTVHAGGTAFARHDLPRTRCASSSTRRSPTTYRQTGGPDAARARRDLSALLLPSGLPDHLTDLVVVSDGPLAYLPTSS